MNICTRVARGVAAAAFVVILAFWAFAVWQVNCLIPQLPVRVAKMGESVDLGNNFLDTSYDLAPGYSMSIKRARSMTAASFLAEEGVSLSEKEAANVVESSSLDVLVVTLEIANRGNAPTEGGMSEVGVSLPGYKIVGADLSKDYGLDQELLELAHPELEGATAFALRPNSTYEINVPFSLSGAPPYLETYDLQYREPIEGNEFAMLVANSPKRVFIKFSLG